MRHRPRPHRRSAPPAPSDTTSAAPSRTPDTRPPGNPRSSAPGRTATNGRFRAEGTPGPRASAAASLPWAHLECRRRPAASEPPRPEPYPTPPPRGRRPATGRHCHTPPERAPSEPPDPATETPTSPTAVTRRRRRRARAIVIPLAPTCRSDPPERSQPAMPRTGTANPSFIFPVDDAVGLNAAACSTLHRAHRAERRPVQRPASHSASSTTRRQRLHSSVGHHNIAIQG